MYSFYFSHALTDLRANGRRTVFALLCIAAGVAAMVSLQTLGSMIVARLTGDLQALNRGDIQISLIASGENREAGIDAGIAQRGWIGVPDSFTEQGIANIQAWAQANFPGQVTQTDVQLRVTNVSSATNASPMTFEYVVQPEDYPLYGQVIDGSGNTLDTLLDSPDSVLLSRDLAARLGVGVGDGVRLGEADQPFTVRGIVSDAQLGNVMESVVGVYYLSDEARPLLKRDTPWVTTLYWRLADPSQTAAVAEAFRAQFPYLQVISTVDLAVQNAQLTGGVRQLVSVMGFLALLIGGIGIVNTMQVIVRRRVLDIAVLKTLGLEGRHITLLFVVESLLMGIVGSILGALLGLGLAFAARELAERFVTQTLIFRVDPAVVLTSVMIGILLTLVFGFLPTLSLGRLRPIVALRPTEALMGRAGCGAQLLTIVGLIIALSLVGMLLLGGAALAIVPGAFVAVGLLYAVLWLLIGIAGRLPSFGIASLRIALRNLRLMRQRGAITLLALTLGVSTLSVVTLLASGFQQQFEASMIQQTGGNVTVFAPIVGNTLQALEDRLSEFEGINSYALVQTYQGKLVSVEDVSTGETIAAETIHARMAAQQGKTLADTGMQSLEQIDARDVVANLPDLPMKTGRMLQPADAGHPVIVLGSDPTTSLAGLEVGDRLTYEFTAGGVMGLGAQTRIITFELIGMTDLPMGRTSPVGGLNYVSREQLDGLNAQLVRAVVQMDEARLPALRQALDGIPGVFVVETATYSAYISGLVNQFSSFPVLMAAVTLIVGAIVIANSVALGTLERRREIATLKAIGMTRERVLALLLLENGVLGIIGGLLGVSLSFFLLLMFAALLGQDTSNLPYGTAFALMLLCIIITLGATLMTAWDAASEKPLNVLRYE